MTSRGLLYAAAGIFTAAVFACSSVACSSEEGTAAAEALTPVCDGNLDAFRFPHGGEGSPDPFGAKAAGQARAGRIRDASQIVQAADARAKVRVGDFILANDRIAAYIEAEGESDGYDTLGGEILALEVVGPDGRPTGISQYNETLIMLSRQSVQPDRVTVIADGSDGKAAIIRASGKLANVPFLDTFRALMPDEYGFPAALDYVLEPGSSRVMVRLSVVNPTVEPVDFSTKQFLGFFHQNRGQTFTEAFAYADPKGEVPWVAWDSGRSAFLVRAAGGAPMRTEIEVAGFQMFSIKGLALDACATKAVDYVEFVPGAPGIDGLLEAKRAAYGEPAWRELRGTVKEPDGVALGGALVHATSADGRYLTRALSDDAGAFVMHVPSGVDVALTTTLKGWAVPAATSVPASTESAAIVLPKRATIEVLARDATTAEPLPVRVQILPSANIGRPPAAWGVRDEANGRLWQEFAVTGRALLPVPPGQHRVIVSRGYEYDIFDAPVTADVGTTTVTASLARSVDSSGVMCADFHIHSNYSADSDDVPESKVKGAIADGLDIPVSSEHEWIIDFQPIIQRLDLTKWAFGFPSEELTTFTFGHFGVVPLFPKPDAVNNGAASWIGKTPAEIFRGVNELPEKPVLIVNHPSGNGLTAYFSQAAFDRAKASGNPELWSDNFGAIEVFNESDFEDNRDKSVADWFALLNTGRTYWAVGNSDSHRERTTPVGYPRTCLRFGHDDPTKLSAELVRDVLRSGAAVISGGLMMAVTGPDGVGPGGTSTPGAYKIAVASPSWFSAESVEVIVDGITTQTVPLTPLAGPSAPGKRYEATVDVAPTQSKARHWVIFHAKAPAAVDLAPLHPGRKPFAVSNPIFF